MLGHIPSIKIKMQDNYFGCLYSISVKKVAGVVAREERGEKKCGPIPGVWK